ncbi:DUF3365 domain-containing protein [uncultured Idiomarina sp.]|uniref:Tll0287-like domain-containing protein n=1 Tax=Idiomarina sp. TaxID=1874361 RepID=UPI000C8B0035|nr:hypothetical protein [Idiomarinaceae bacterium]
MRMLILMLVLLPIISYGAEENDRSNEDFRSAAMLLGAELKSVLMTTIQKDGYIKAVDVCNHEAPEIASKITETTGLNVGRTSLRVRNPENSPTEEQKQVLREFETRWRTTQANPPETSYVDKEGNTVWMKAIVMQPQCVACHGANLAPALKKEILSRYPKDEAIDFQPGQLRGAFVVTSK